MFITQHKRVLQQDHDTMCLNVVFMLKAYNYGSIKADLPGYLQPDQIFWKNTGAGHIPDVTAWGNQKFHLFEVETRDSIHNSHTSDQWTLFAAYAVQHNAAFIVIVPAGCKYSAENRLKALGITAGIIEV